jgi:hypothetical protein
MDNIIMDFGETGWGGMGCTDLADNRNHWRTLVNMVINEECCLLDVNAVWLL